MNNNTYLTIKEVSELLGKSQNTIRSWIKNGDLEALKIKRSYFIPKKQLEAIL